MGSRSNSRLLAARLNWKRPTSENCSEKQIKPPICHLTLFSPLSCLDLKDDWSQGPDSWRKCCKGGSIYLQWVVAMLVQDAVSCRKFCPHPRVWSFLKKKKKKKEILDCLRPPHWHGATQVTCLCLEGVPVAPWEEGLEKSGRPPAGPAPQMCWGAVIIIRRLK